MQAVCKRYWRAVARKVPSEATGRRPWAAQAEAALEMGPGERSIVSGP